MIGVIGWILFTALASFFLGFIFGARLFEEEISAGRTALNKKKGEK